MHLAADELLHFYCSLSFWSVCLKAKAQFYPSKKCAFFVPFQNPRKVKLTTKGILMEGPQVAEGACKILEISTTYVVIVSVMGKLQMQNKQEK